mmetsp:Transcript_23880/g.54574  ORF Transcript_23880/g.54574 Transcript_23880/m.54574 type:complete len:299 (-) Transcript_23880:80-976(-)
MDDFEDETNSAEGTFFDFIKPVLIPAVHFAASILVGKLIYRCLYGGKASSQGQQEARDKANKNEFGLEHLEPKKRLATSYALWLLGGPLANAYHFYLGRVVHGLVATWTLNFFGFGWALDAVLLPCYVSRANARCHGLKAPYDGTHPKVFVRLPVMILALVVFGASTVAYIPWALNKIGVVDIDIVAAQTQTNPYELLGIPYSASMAEAKSAYRKQSLKWHPDRNQGCGKKCEDKMSEVTKAFDLIKKRHAPPPVDRSWSGFFQNIFQDWMHLFEALDLASYSSSSSEDRAGSGKSDL